MKIGIVAQYLDSRNDIRELIEWLAKENDVYLFVRKRDLKNQIKGVTVREIKAKKRSVKNEILIRLFYLFGNIPRSRNNYFITESFKIANTKTKAYFKFEKKTLLSLSKYLPKFISYDIFLDNIDYSTQTNVEDIEKFLFFSEVYDDFLLAHLLHIKKKLFIYVYSWDHPCKMMKFSKRIYQYFVWNEGLKEDMIELQGIQEEKISVLGASQLCYIKEFQEAESSFTNPFPFNYIYFGCATGTKSLVLQEVEIIEYIAQILQSDFPSIKLVVRPYPFLAAWHLYDGLKKYKNVVLDNNYRESIGGFNLSRENIYEKFVKIQHAKAFVHLGTTMGFEATYFNTPVLQINYCPSAKGNLTIDGFIHQYQNDKYLILEKYPNVIQGRDDLLYKLKELSTLPDNFLNYNYNIAAQTTLYTFHDLSRRLTSLIN